MNKIFYLIIIGFLFGLSTIFENNDVFGYSFVGITSNGVEIPIKSSTGNNEGTGDGEGDGAGDGESMIDGMGIQSRIIQQEYTAKLIHGTGNIGVANSLVPYLPVDSNTDFVGLVENTDKVLTYFIPEFWKSYSYGDSFTTDDVQTVTEDVSWTSVVGAVVDGNTLREEHGSCNICSSGAVSLQTIGPDGGHVSYRFGDARHIIIGLSNGDTDQSQSDIDFSIRTFNHALHVRENGNFVERVPGLVPDDIIRISAESGVVKYYKNDVLLHTSENSPTYPLLIDASMTDTTSGGVSMVTGVRVTYENHFTTTTPDRLDDITGTIPNILGYSDYTSMSGENEILVTHEGMILSGTGVIVIKPNIIDDVILRGTLPEGADVKIVTSPLDLTTISMSGDNYILSQTTPSKVQTSYSETNHRHVNKGGTSYNHLHVSQTWDMVSNLNVVVAVDSDLTGRYDTSQSCTGIVRNSQCHSIGPTDHHHPKCYYSACYESHGHSFSASGTSTLDTVDVPEGVKITKQTTTGSKPAYASKTHTITSTHPWDEKYRLTENFDQRISIPDNLYFVVTLNGENLTIKGESLGANQPILSIYNLDSNVPYQIIKDGRPIVTGMTSPSGTITVDNLENAPSTLSGLLHLYPDSLSYRGSFSTVILDKLNHQTTHILTRDDKVYTVHAYVNVPVTGSVTINNVHLNGDDILSLPYLDVPYENGDAVSVPIIPGYSSVSMEINGVETSLQFGNVLGGRSIKIAESNTSTINKKSLNTRIGSVEAIVGTTQYIIATSDGKVNAIVTETISGSALIANRYVLEEIPPPPPPPVRRDPLSGWVDIFVNGEKIQSTTLGVNPHPNFTPGNGLSGNVATQSVSYSYPDYVMSGAVSVDVNAGDFVEFYLYAKIHGDIDGYSAPPGFTVSSESGTSTATVNIRSASILSSQQ